MIQLLVWDQKGYRCKHWSSKTRESETHAGGQDKRNIPAQEEKVSLYPSFKLCSFWAFSELMRPTDSDEDRTSPMHSWIVDLFWKSSSTPRNDVHQLPGHPLAQSGGHWQSNHHSHINLESNGGVASYLLVGHWPIYLSSLWYFHLLSSKMRCNKLNSIDSVCISYASQSFLCLGTWRMGLGI